MMPGPAFAKDCFSPVTVANFVTKLFIPVETMGSCTNANDWLACVHKVCEVLAVNFVGLAKPCADDREVGIF